MSSIPQLDPLFAFLTYIFTKAPPYVYLFGAAIIVAAIFGFKEAFKHRVVEKTLDESSMPRMPTAQEYLKRLDEIEKQVLDRAEGQAAREFQNGHDREDWEDKIIGAVVDAITAGHVSAGGLKLIIDPEAKKKITLGASSIDFTFGNGKAEPEGKSKVAEFWDGVGKELPPMESEV